MADKDWIQYLPHHNCREIEQFIDPDFDKSVHVFTCDSEGESYMPWTSYANDQELEIQPYQWLYKDPVTSRITIFDVKPEETS